MVEVISKVAKILEPKEKKKLYFLLLMMGIGMMLEVLGVGVIIPILSVITTDSIGTTYPELMSFIVFIGSPNHEQLIALAMIILVFIYFIKTMFLALLNWLQVKFIFNLQAALSLKLFSGYLKLPYTFHLQRNSSELIRNTTGEVNQFTSTVQALMYMLSESLVLLGIGVFLIVVEPLGAMLIIIVLSLSSLLFYWKVRSRLLIWGEQRQYNEGRRIRHIQQGLGGVKEFKLLGREDNFVSQYNGYNVATANVLQKQAFIQQMPRLWLELTSIISLSVLVIVMITQSKEINTIVPTLGLFAAAAFRLMPASNRVLSSIQQLRYGLPVIDIIKSEISIFRESVQYKFRENSGRMLFSNSIKFNNVSYRYPNAAEDTLKDIEIEIKAGSTVGFIGESGAGKSTLIDMLLGVLELQKGSVTVDNVGINKDIRSWQDQIGYVPQTIFLTDDTLRRNIAIGLPDNKINENDLLRAVSAAQLDKFCKSLDEGLNTLVGENGVRLSGGQRQRIGIARALYHNPSILVLDEATSALDESTEAGVMSAINELHGKKTIVIIAHRLTTIENCDYLYRLDAGRVVEYGKPTEILK